jgi:hypothetical protein
VFGGEARRADMQAVELKEGDRRPGVSPQFTILGMESGQFLFDSSGGKT